MRLRKFKLFFLLTVCFHIFTTDTRADILENASVSFFAKNISKGEIIKNENSELSLIPASILKVVTTAGATEILTPQYKFKTKLSYDGTIDEDGVLHGNIYIEGGNDPCLGSIHFMNHYNNPELFGQWFAAIKNHGIKYINGSIISDSKYPEASFYPLSWTIYDKNKNYGTCWNTLSYSDNIVHITIIKRNGNYFVENVYPALPKNFNIKIESYNKYENCSKKIFFDKINQTLVVRLLFNQKMNKTTVKVPLCIPEYWLSSSLHYYLLSQGIKISSPPVHKTHNNNKRTPLYTVISPNLGEIVKITNRKSINNYAEQLLAELSYYFTRNHFHRDKNYILKWHWSKKGIYTKGMYMYDGSGLSRYNSITTRTIVEILEYMNLKSPYYKQFFSYLGENGFYGSFGNDYFQDKNLRSNIIGKAGLLSRVASFTGILNNKNNEKIVFAIIVNNHSGTRKQINEYIEKRILELMN